MVHVTASQSLRIRLAESRDDLIAVQQLRWKVFYEEKGAQPPEGAAAAGIDGDAFDAISDHLLVLDGENAVGTYRLLRGDVARAHGDFYSAAEFDLSALASFQRRAGGELLELGRSCVLPLYRNGTTIALLWRGIADYLLAHRICLMIGCGSFAGTDVAGHAAGLSYLAHNHLAPQELRPFARPVSHVEMERLPIGSYDRRRAFQSLPPLIKAYLRIGAMVGDGAFLDRQFNTIDVCIVMPVEHITRRYALRFSVAA